MKQELSILIPVYNNICTTMVEQLSLQAESIQGLNYEIIVADDGSTDETSVMTNEAIEQLPHTYYIKRDENQGRSAIRNFLARHAHYQWLLFIDCDMVITHHNFLLRYLQAANSEVVIGGYSVGKGEQSNLRYCYEKEAEPHHTAEQRRLHPYRHFHASNFLISREVMLSSPFDERFRHYGYEDVLLGKQLSKANISIEHIDNTVGFHTFETNANFVSKTEEGLLTLHEFRNELRGYNGLLTIVEGIHLNIVKSIIRLWHKAFGPIERRWLCGKHPNLTVFKLYKLGYYLSLTKND